MAGNWLWAAAHLEFAELIAGKNEEELDVVKEEIHLRQAAASERSRRGAGALQSYRPYRVRQERKGQPQEADARRPGARRLLQRLQLAGGSMREGAAATWGDGPVPDKSAQPEELAGQKRGGLQLLEVERLQRLCSAACQEEKDVGSSSKAGNVTH
jgi:hypothetical protein